MMAKRKAETVAFLDSKVGTTIKDKVNSSLNGQCVTEIKALLEFLGVSNPYAARGNAKDYATTLVNQGIATDGKGTINIVVNPTMGVVGNNVYGHIWAEIDGQNWEQNGAKALVVTKNTRPSIQGRQWVNLDKWLATPQPPKEEVMDGESIIKAYMGFMGRKESEVFDRANGKWVDPGAESRQGLPTKQMIDEIYNSDEAKEYRAKVEKALAGSDQYVKVEELYRKV